MGLRLALFFHLLGFAAYLGAGFAQTNFLKASAHQAETAVRDAYERLTAMIVTRIELPAIFVAVGSGIAMIIQVPQMMQHHWLHAKLTGVLGLLVLSHLEMFNARKLVRAREAKQEAEVEARKKRHALFGTIGTILLALVFSLAALQPQF